MTMTDLRAFLGECHATVTRGGIEDACGKPAAGWAKPSGDETHPWPACAYHLNRWGGMPLTAVLPDLLADAWDEGQAACIEAHGRIKPMRPNPYRPETITRDATDAPEAPAAPDATNPPPDPSAAVTEPHSTERTTR